MISNVIFDKIRCMIHPLAELLIAKSKKKNALRKKKLASVNIDNYAIDLENKLRQLIFNEYEELYERMIEESKVRYT